MGREGHQEMVKADGSGSGGSRKQSAARGSKCSAQGRVTAQAQGCGVERRQPGAGRQRHGMAGCAALSLRLLLERVCNFLGPRSGHHHHHACTAAHDQAQRARGIRHSHWILRVCRKERVGPGRAGSVGQAGQAMSVSDRSERRLLVPSYEPVAAVLYNRHAWPAARTAVASVAARRPAGFLLHQPLRYSTASSSTRLSSWSYPLSTPTTAHVVRQRKQREGQALRPLLPLPPPTAVAPRAWRRTFSSTGQLHSDALVHKL